MVPAVGTLKLFKPVVLKRNLKKKAVFRFFFSRIAANQSFLNNFTESLEI